LQGEVFDEPGGEAIGRSGAPDADSEIEVGISFNSRLALDRHIMWVCVSGLAITDKRAKETETEVVLY